ncbi:MAG: purine-binding chemotaxis protein CheW [Clostridiales bacterium]|jgi:purine-binding chemotaxis protein CheW|nr:purine-binding chemotaxis protein CheW [Clostridiales bacterium]
MQIVVFTLGLEKFALETQLISGIEKVLNITRVPNTQNYIRGLANLRGNIITIIDLKKYLNMENIMNEENVIILQSGDERIGLMVDSVHEVVEITNDMLEKSSDPDDYIKGIVNFKEYIVTLLEGETLLNRRE